MNSENILYFFIGLVIFNFLFTTVLDYINDKNWKDEIPDDFKDFYDSESYLKAKEYKIERGRLSTISSSLNLIFTVLMLYFFGYGFISDYAISISDSIFRINFSNSDRGSVSFDEFLSSCANTENVKENNNNKYKLGYCLR